MTPLRGDVRMTPQPMIQLVAPTLDLESAYRDCEADFASQGETFLGASATDWRAFVTQCAEEAQGIVRDPARVPQTVLLLARVWPAGVTLLGVAKLRHMLTPTLEDIGGHIGYSIRPS